MSTFIKWYRVLALSLVMTGLALCFVSEIIEQRENERCMVED